MEKKYKRQALHICFIIPGLERSPKVRFSISSHIIYGKLQIYNQGYESINSLIQMVLNTYKRTSMWSKFTQFYELNFFT